MFFPTHTQKDIFNTVNGNSDPHKAKFSICLEKKKKKSHYFLTLMKLMGILPQLRLGQGFIFINRGLF